MSMPEYVGFHQGTIGSCENTPERIASFGNDVLLPKIDVVVWLELTTRQEDV